MLKLKLVLDAIEPKQADLARSLQLSKATIAQLINHGLWPKSLDRTELEQRIRDWLLSNGTANDAIGDVFEEVQVDQPCANTADPQPPEAFDQNNQESEPMLKRKQTLMPAARKAFALLRDPFDDLTCADDMYVSQDIRYVRECMYQVARHDGFLDLRFVADIDVSLRWCTCPGAPPFLQSSAWSVIRVGCSTGAD